MVMVHLNEKRGPCGFLGRGVVQNSNVLTWMKHVSFYKSVSKITMPMLYCVRHYVHCDDADPFTR